MTKAQKAPANKKPRSKKSSKVQHKGLYIAFAITAIVAVIAWFGYSWVDSTLKNEYGYKLRSQPKAEAKQNLKEISSSFSFPGKLASNFIDDEGCTETKVSLQTYINCRLQAKKFYINSGDPSASIRKVHQTLTSKGWQVDQSLSTKTLEDFLNGEREGSLSYVNKKEKASLLLSFYPYGTTKYDNDVNNTFKLDKDISFDKNEYAYDIMISYSYWSCSSGSIISPYQHCPSPPTPVKNKH